MPIKWHKYSEDSVDNETDTPDYTLCLPRSIPGYEVIRGNRSFLSISDSTRGHLNSSVTVALVPALYTLVFLIGLPSNGLAFWILASEIKKMTSTIFLLNLAVADLLLIAVLPFKISYYLLGNHWLFGETMCRIVTALFYGNMYCSVLLLMSISIDRYIAVVHPFFSRSFRSKTFAICLCMSIWIIAVASTLPLTVFQQSYDLDRSDLTLCHDVLPRHELSEYFFYHFVCLITLGFLVPLLVILFCYISVIRVLNSNGEKYSYAIKLTILSLVITVVFLTPSNVVLLIHYTERCLSHFGDLYVIYMICLALSTFNNCIDPFVYYYVSEEFRQKVRQKILRRGKMTVISTQTTKEALPISSSTTQSVV
ncbi:proteinase-activated receptor 4 isoform X2 [Ambystoma mexicanum]|uniref:proteinase-activated receptor 4 isoform X2 n=1 Tax=Ambystoma mexicanum TaxID=8296 RepID=UPI0037E8DA65